MQFAAAVRPSRRSPARHFPHQPGEPFGRNRTWTSCIAHIDLAREGTKQALFVGMLGRAEGATIAEIVAATGWQPHTVRGAFAGALKKRLGLTSSPKRSKGAAGSTGSLAERAASCAIGERCSRSAS